MRSLRTRQAVPQGGAGAGIPTGCTFLCVLGVGDVSDVIAICLCLSWAMPSCGFNFHRVVICHLCILCLSFAHFLIRLWFRGLFFFPPLSSFESSFCVLGTSPCWVRDS